MKIVILLAIAGITIAAGFLVAFIWAVRSGQYDDVYTPSVRILHDDKPEENTSPESQNNTH